MKMEIKGNLMLQLGEKSNILWSSTGEWGKSISKQEVLIYGCWSSVAELLSSDQLDQVFCNVEY